MGMLDSIYQTLVRNLIILVILGKAHISVTVSGAYFCSCALASTLGSQMFDLVGLPEEI